MALNIKCKISSIASNSLASSRVVANNALSMRGRVLPSRSRRHVAVRAASLDVIKMAPLGDRVLIKPKEKEEKSAGGVILTGGSGSGMGDGVLTGTVVSVGEDVDVGVTAGDYVLFTKYGSSDIETDEGSVSFVAQKSILAKLS